MDRVGVLSGPECQGRLVVGGHDVPADLGMACLVVARCDGGVGVGVKGGGVLHGQESWTTGAEMWHFNNELVSGSLPKIVHTMLKCVYGGLRTGGNTVNTLDRCTLNRHSWQPLQVPLQHVYAVCVKASWISLRAVEGLLLGRMENK